MSWIIRMSLSNMKKRRTRTLLTILGVVIGTVSIVSMISVGLGYSGSVMNEITKSGNPNEIRVYDNTGNDKVDRKDRKLTDKTIKKIEELEGVTKVYPVISLDGYIKLGKYETYAEIQGVPAEYLETKLLQDGNYPEEGTFKPELVAGKGLAYMLYNINSGVSYESTMSDKDTFTGKKIDFSYYNEPDRETLSEMTSAEEDIDTYDEFVRSVKLSVAGTTDNEYDYGVYTDIETLKKYIRKNKNGTKLPGQPLDKEGRALKEWIYSGLIVETESMEDVDRVTKAISNLGYRAENNKKMIESANKTTSSVKLLLGIVGTIALVVAVIGIVNTMSTAVYDRMNEIGTLKLIGCDSDDILFMFLFESGILGALGGTIGVVVSFLVNHFIIDKKIPGMLDLPKGIAVTCMPWQLVAGAILLAVVISILAGIIPSRYAASLKPLEAATGVN